VYSTTGFTSRGLCISLGLMVRGLMSRRLGSLHAEPAYLKERATLHFNIASVSYEYRKCIALVGTLSLLFPWRLPAAGTATSQRSKESDCTQDPILPGPWMPPETPFHVIVRPSRLQSMVRTSLTNLFGCVSRVLEA